MNRKHALLIAIALGVAAVAGTLAAVQTTSLGAEAATVSDSEITKRQRQLDRAAANLRRQAKRRPPALPAMPASSGGGTVAFRSGPSASSGSAAPVVLAAPAPASAPAPAPQGSHHDDDDDWDDHDDDRDDDHDDWDDDRDDRDDDDRDGDRDDD